jgi:hypothetical protein
VIDEDTRFAVVAGLQRKSEAELAVRNAIAWFECQTDLRVQRVRSDRGGECMGKSLLRFYEEKGIEREPGPGHSPEVNSFAERHQLTMQDVALPSLADSGDERHGLTPLSDRFAGYALAYANDIHNAMPASRATIGHTPYEGLLGRQVTLGVFRRFSCRCWVNTPGKPFAHRRKFEPRARPGRFLGFDKPFGSGIYKVLLDSGEVTQSQTVVFDDAPHVPPPVLLPEGEAWQQSQRAGEAAEASNRDSDSEDEMQMGPTVPAVPPFTPSAGASNDDSDSADEVDLHRYPAGPAVPTMAPAVQTAAPPTGPAAPPVGPAAPPAGRQQSAQAEARQLTAPAVGRPVRATRNAYPRYANAAVRELAQGIGGTRGEPDCCSRVRGPSRAPVRMASAQLGSITWHDLTDTAKGKTRAARSQAQWQRRREVADAVSGRETAKARVERASAGKAAEQCRPKQAQRRRRAQRGASLAASPETRTTRSEPVAALKCAAGSSWCRNVVEDMAAFTAAVVAPGPHSHALPPRTVTEALSRPDADKWQVAIDTELGSCLDYGVWEEVGLPEGKQALPSFFIFEIKRDGRHKARLVAGGHRQRQGLDLDETYASVGSYRTMRMMMAVAAHEDLELRQFDVRTAFLNGWLKDEVYLQVPHGLVRKLGTGGKVLRLRRAIYGLKQASRAWNERLEGELARRGFVQSDSDPSLWILHGKDGAVLALFYVDDGLVAARTGEQADALVDLVASIFEIRKLGEPVDFLGIEIQRDRESGTITLMQKAKAEVLAAAHGVQGACRATPMSPECFASLRAAQPGEPMADRLGYQKVVGSLLHLAQCTRPDIALPVGALAAYASAPSEAHYEAMLDVVRYVGSTAGRGLTYGGSNKPLGFWCDSNFAACQDTRRSTTGWVVVMYGGAVSWASKKQPTVAVSTMDADHQACGAAAREGLSLGKALGELAFLSSDFPLGGPVVIRCDNKAALSLCKDRKEGQRVKHIDIIHHFARDHVASGELSFVYCKSAENVSDCLTKALTRHLFEKGLMGLGMVSV